MPSKEAKRRKYLKKYHAANKDKISAYGQSYSQEYDRKDYYHDYYGSDRN